ncbi:DUF6338 family protein [Priestia aryabhattai]
MKSLISLIIFTLPGLLAYFWINLFGLTPTTKRDSSEVIAISALLWIPTVATILIIYQIMAGLSHVIHAPFDVWIIKKDWTMLSSTITDINKLTDNIWFLLYYVLLSLVISFLLAILVFTKGYPLLLGHINKVRKSRGVAPLSSQSTVWNEMFLNNQGQIVEYIKGDGTVSLTGCLIRVPRAHEPDKSIVLEAVDHWTNVMDYYDVPIDNTFIDTITGAVIKVYNTTGAEEAQQLYNERVNNGSIS